MEGTSSIPFKNLHSREYQGHKKKVLSVSLFLSLYSLFHFFSDFILFSLSVGATLEKFMIFIVAVNERCIRWLGIARAQSSLRVLSIKPLDYGTLSHTAMYAFFEFYLS